MGDLMKKLHERERESLDEPPKQISKTLIGKNKCKKYTNCRIGNGGGADEE